MHVCVRAHIRTYLHGWVGVGRESRSRPHAKREEQRDGTERYGGVGEWGGGVIGDCFEIPSVGLLVCQSVS